MQSRITKLAVAGAVAFALGTVTGWSATGVSKTIEAATAASPSAASDPIPRITVPNYREIVARNQAAVVGITTASERKVSASPEQDLDGNDPFSQFFRMIPRGPGNGGQGYGGQGGGGMMHAQGSGFLISADGLLLTNAHVVDGASTVTVKLSDHREFKAKVLGADKTSDIAVLKIDAHGLPTVRLGDSEQIAVGDYVLAIGEPFGLEETATAGIVSAKARSLPGDGYVPFIQTDAAVNPGNSGGPLFDANGSVVGINAQIYSSSGGYQGVSFAIPINVAIQVKDQIVKTGRVAHAQLGVEVQTLDQSLADSFNLKAPNGAVIAKVHPDSAAARAGLKVGDVILKYDGTPIVDAGQLSSKVGTSAPGQKASVEIWRDGKYVTVGVTIGTAVAVEMAEAGSGASDQPRLGLSVRPLNPDEREQAGVDGGLVVQDAQGPAAEAGLQRGDLVLSVDGTSVKSADQLRKIIGQHDKHVAMLIQRGNDRLFVPVTLG